jgi:hypothetical protein
MTTPRFQPVDPDQTHQYVEDHRNKNTVKKTALDVRLFTEFLETQNCLISIEDIPAEELDKHLAMFFLSVRKVKPDERGDTEYEPDTLSAMSNSVARYLRQKGYKWELKTDPAFKHSRDVLQSKRKGLKSQGKGNKDRQAEPFTKDEIEILKTKSLIGTGENMLENY